MCLYDLEHYGGEILVDILKTHPKVLMGGTVLENLYYLEPDEFLASRQMTPPPAGLAGDTTVRDLLSSLSALQVLSMVMVDASGEERS